MTENLNSGTPTTMVGNQLRVWLAQNTNKFFIAHSFRGSRKLRELTAKLLMPAPKGPTIIRTIYGFDMIVDPITDKGLERAIYFSGTYEAGTLNIIKSCLKQGDTFIDVGANIGLMSLFASTIVGNEGAVYSFEPESEVFAILQQNIEINKISNIRPYNFALGSTQEKTTIYRNIDISRGSASLVKPGQKNADHKEVAVESLDGFASMHNIRGIRMLKLDVEGWELEVLKGANHLLSDRQAPIICSEYSSAHPVQDGQLEDIYKYILSVNDYEIFKLRKGKDNLSRLVKIADAADLPYHDNLFCFLPTHLKDVNKSIFEKVPSLAKG